MDTRIILSVAGGVFIGYTSFVLIVGTIRGIVKWFTMKAEAKIQQARREKQAANRTGRVIGFRPIEQEARA